MPKNKIPEDIKRQIKDEKPKARKFWRLLLIILITGQLVFTDFLVYQIANAKLHLSEVMFSVFLTKVFAEIAGFIYIALKYDFSD